MKTQTAMVARNYRLQQWAEMVRDCNNRPTDMSVAEWCQNNSITKANYYYRMTQVRKACLDAMPTEVVEPAIVPVPLELMSPKSAEPSTYASDNSFIELSSHGVTLRVTPDTSDALLSKVLGVLAHVE